MKRLAPTSETRGVFGMLHLPMAFRPVDMSYLRLQPEGR